MNEELKCPKCQQKDKVIARLKLELEQANHVLSSIFDMAERNNGVLYFR
jgi:predicted nucleic-acid-binding Zn-ribbon protein